jgi:hypothetical protein
VKRKGRPGVLLYENVDPAAMKRTRVVRDSETGLPLIITEQHTKPIIEDNRRLANNVDRHDQRRRRTSGSGMVQVASIPIVIWRQLKESGVANDETRLLQWLSERDHRYFRTDDGRKLA